MTFYIFRSFLQKLPCFWLKLPRWWCFRWTICECPHAWVEFDGAWLQTNECHLRSTIGDHCGTVLWQFLASFAYTVDSLYTVHRNLESAVFFSDRHVQVKVTAIDASRPRKRHQTRLWMEQGSEKGGGKADSSDFSWQRGWMTSAVSASKGKDDKGKGKDDKGKGKGKGKDPAQAHCTSLDIASKSSWRHVWCSDFFRCIECIVSISLLNQVPPGTVASDAIAQPSHMNFFLVSQQGATVDEDWWISMQSDLVPANQVASGLRHWGNFCALPLSCSSLGQAPGEERDRCGWFGILAVKHRDFHHGDLFPFPPNLAHFSISGEYHFPAVPHVLAGR